MLWDFSEAGEESSWHQDIYEVEPKIMEAAEDLGYEIEGVKRHDNSPSPKDPIERHTANYLVFDGDLDDTGTYSGIRAEYTPQSLTVERALEDEMTGFLKTGVFFQGPESEQINDTASLIASTPNRKDYDAMIAEDIIEEMADAKMTSIDQNPDITKPEDDDIFRYIYPL